MNARVEEGMERTLEVVTDVQDRADLLAGASVDQVQLVSAANTGRAQSARRSVSFFMFCLLSWLTGRDV